MGESSPREALVIVALGCDHAGFPLKGRVAREIEGAGHTVLDCGAFAENPDDDYPDFALATGEAVARGKAERGIVVCGSGVGVSVAANKVRGVRAAMCHETFSARQGVEDDSMNVLCIGARVIGPELAAEVVRAYLRARFSGAERHARRLAKVLAIEAGRAV
jgi:ribose 5-phosphate isomerase B